MLKQTKQRWRDALDQAVNNDCVLTGPSIKGFMGPVDEYHTAPVSWGPLRRRRACTQNNHWGSIGKV